MSVAHHREREVTLDVDDDWTVPDLSGMAPPGGRVETAEHELTATYYDTALATLRRLGMTLRHREGGADAGWHLKIPAGGARTEVQSRAGAGPLPAALRRRIAGVVGDDAVRPVATIRTIRRTTQILDDTGDLVVELADDRVTGTAAGADDSPVVWREVEVELGDAGAEEDLDRVTALLDGARPAVVTRKITHVLGEPPTVEPDGLPGVVVGYLREQCAAVLLGDVGIRDDPTPEAVHATRVALRRLRSTLRLFDHVVDDVPQSFDDDLGWYAGLLSPVRDADILGRRLAGALDELAPQDVVGPVPDEVSRALRASRRNALEECRRAGEEPRYRGIMATLVRWYASVPVRDDVRVRPRRTLRKARRTAERRLAGATDAHGLHRARKAAKRLRYTADLLAPAVPDARKTAKRAKRMQTTLGDHQDLAVASDFVRSLARSGEVENGFTYGVLADRFDQHAARIRSAVLDG
jgi:CHAD domain-containing protein